MLKGLEVDENPMQKALLQSAAQELETVYEDEWLLVVNKPAGMLSVPGKEEAVSVYSVMRRRYPEADGPLIVHLLGYGYIRVAGDCKDQAGSPKPASAIQRPQRK